MTKLPPAKNWHERHIDDWTTLTFTEYLRAKHEELFGITYAPFGGTWAMEQGIIGGLIGTSSPKNPKPRTASNDSLKRFIDETFESYTPNARYPGTSFGFMWTYRKNVWQQIQAEEKTRELRQQAVEESPEIDDLTDWL